MLKVTIELVSAVTGRVSEIGRMYIANDGHGTADRGDYIAAVCRRGTEDVPRELYQNPEAKAPIATRAGKIGDYPRLAYNVWRLIARSLLACFPEEKSAKALKSGTPQLDESVMRGLQALREHFENDGHDWHADDTMQHVDRAIEWLDASKRDDL